MDSILFRNIARFSSMVCLQNKVKNIYNAYAKERNQSCYSNEQLISFVTLLNMKKKPGFVKNYEKLKIIIAYIFFRDEMASDGEQKVVFSFRST